MLKDGRLFYFKTWEDYGSGGKATNLKEPIEMQPQHATSSHGSPASGALQLATLTSAGA